MATVDIWTNFSPKLSGLLSSLCVQVFGHTPPTSTALSRMHPNSPAAFRHSMELQAY